MKKNTLIAVLCILSFCNTVHTMQSLIDTKTRRYSMPPLFSDVPTHAELVEANARHRTFRQIRAEQEKIKEKQKNFWRWLKARPEILRP